MNMCVSGEKREVQNAVTIMCVGDISQYDVLSHRERGKIWRDGRNAHSPRSPRGHMMPSSCRCSPLYVCMRIHILFIFVRMHPPHLSFRFDRSRSPALLLRDDRHDTNSSTTVRLSASLSRMCDSLSLSLFLRNALNFSDRQTKFPRTI